MLPASNHHLVIANLKLKLKRNWEGAAPQRNRYDIGCLKDVRKLGEFRVTVRNRSQILRDLMEDDKTVDSSWKVVKESFVAACKAVLGPKKYHHKDWISAETLGKIRVRKEKKAAVNSSRTRAERSKALKKYSNAHKSTKKGIRADKTKYMDGIAEVAEQAARAGNMKGLYDTTKKLAEKFGNPERRVKDKTGRKIVGEEQQKKRWVEHFEELLNRSPPQNPPVILPAAQDLDIESGILTRDEIRMAIRQRKSGKAPGPDGIPCEALKTDIETTIYMLYLLFEKIWEVEEVPLDWKEGYLIKLPKKDIILSFFELL